MSTSSNEDSSISDLLYNTELLNMPGFTTDEREEFIKWLDHIQTVCMNVFYATAPDELWKDKALFSFVLIGQTDKRDTKMKRGMYCIDLPEAYDVAYRDPIAAAFDYLAKAPEHFKFVPSALSAVLPKPTAHERFSSRMFFIKLCNDNAENKDLCEWASKLK
jgi:hypothetical protein